MNEQSFEETVSRICEKNNTYHVEAYYFIREALNFTTKALNKSPDNRHLTGAELSHGIRRYALEQFGPIAFDVLSDWNLHTTHDFGEIVFQLINEGVFGKSESDRMEDFDQVFDFREAFVLPFHLPAEDVPIPEDAYDFLKKTYGTVTQ